MPTLTRNRKPHAVITDNLEAIATFMKLLGNEGVRIDISCHMARTEPSLGSASEVKQLIDALYISVNTAGARKSELRSPAFQASDVTGQAPAFRRLVDWATTYAVGDMNSSIKFDPELTLKEVARAAMVLFNLDSMELA